MNNLVGDQECIISEIIKTSLKYLCLVPGLEERLPRHPEVKSIIAMKRLFPKNQKSGASIMRAQIYGLVVV